MVVNDCRAKFNWEYFQTKISCAWEKYFNAHNGTFKWELRVAKYMNLFWKIKVESWIGKFLQAGEQCCEGSEWNVSIKNNLNLP